MEKKKDGQHGKEEGNLEDCDSDVDYDIDVDRDGAGRRELRGHLGKYVI